MQVTYELTQRDFSDAFIAHRNQFPLRKWLFRLLVMVMLSLMVVSVISLAAHPNSETFATLVPLMVLAGLWALFAWIAPWRLARTQFRKQPGAQGPRTMMLDTMGTHSRWNGGSADVEWKNYIRFVEGKNQFLMYSSPAYFIILPKRALTPGQLVEFRSFLTHNIRPGNSAR